MWVKFVTMSAAGDAIFLPCSWAKKLKADPMVRFGSCDPIHAKLIFTYEIEARHGLSYERPLTIGLSQDLINKLCLPVSQIYQMKMTETEIAIGPVIGLLLGVHAHRYNPIHMQKYSDRMGIYNQIGGLIYAFSPKAINWGKRQAFGLFYNIIAAKWEYGCFPLPEVIYRRDFHSNPRYIKALTEITDGRLFNSHRFTKMDLYKYLNEYDDMIKYLPPTELSSDFAQVSKFIDRYNKVILKPLDLSRGRGICIIEKTGSSYTITDYRDKFSSALIIETISELEVFFSQNQTFFNKYLIQRYIKLASIDSAIFDVRVVMHKHNDKSWGCTGIECRVTKNSHLTNISRGGYALTLEDALKSAFADGHEQISDHIHRFCIEVCKKLDLMGHHFGEFGLDIAVDENKSVWLIEANVFPSFKGFKRTDMDTYYAIRHMPLLYALSLTAFKSPQ